MRQLPDVAQRLHARTIAVDVATRSRPARSQHREPLETGLTQVLSFLGADFDVAGPERHIQVVGLGLVVILARLDGMDDRDPLVKALGVVGLADGFADILQPKLADQLTDGHVKFAVQGIDLAAVIRADGVLPGRQRVAADDIIIIRKHQHDTGAICAELLIKHVQGAVQVRPVEYPSHLFGDIRTPFADIVGVASIRPCQIQPKPRTRRRGHASHQPGRQRAQCAGPRPVQDLVVLLSAIILP